MAKLLGWRISPNATQFTKFSIIWTVIICILLLGCESNEEMQAKLQKNETATVNTISDAPANPVEPASQPTKEEEVLKPTLEEKTPAPIEEINAENPTIEVEIIENPCLELPKPLCNQKEICEFTVNLNTGKQYCRQRCKIYPANECGSASGCVVRYDRRNQSVCLTDCSAFTNEDLCNMHADCGWKEDNCTTIGYR